MTTGIRPLCPLLACLYVFVRRNDSALLVLVFMRESRAAVAKSDEELRYASVFRSEQEAEAKGAKIEKRSFGPHA